MIEAILTASFFAPFVILTSIWGVALLAVYLIVVGALFEDDWWFRGLLFLAIPLYVAYGLGVVAIPSWRGLGYIAAGYLAIGVVWSFLRWMIFVYDLKKVIQDFVRLKPNWDTKIRSDKGLALWAFLASTRDFSGYVFADHLDSEEVTQRLNLVPNLSHWHCKARVFSWIVYWPFSVLSYVYNRLIKDLVDFIIERMKGVYNIIARQIMKGLEV